MNAAERGRLLEEVGQLAYDNLSEYGGCAQCVLAALQEKMGMQDAGAFRAATTLAGGVARMGESCGALTGALLAVGLAVGREKLEDKDQAGKAMAPAEALYSRFQKEAGATLCSELQKRFYGRAFSMTDPEDCKALGEATAKAPYACKDLCRDTAKIAAEILIDLREEKR